MRFLEFMSFELSWFTTVPGLLISGGVLLLLIALIVFIATSKKDKGKTVDPTVDGSIPLVGGPDDVNGMMMNDVNNGMPADVNGMVNNGVAADNVGMVNNAMGDMNIGGFNQPVDVNANAMASVNPVAVPAVPEASVLPQSIPSMEIPEVPTPMGAPMVDAEPIIPTNTNIAFDNVPPTTLSDSVNPEMQPVLDLGSVSPNPVVDFTSSTNQSEPTLGQSQNNGFVDNSSRPIYGGANPLENTASIPTVASHTAYNGEPIIPNSVIDEVKVVDNNTVATDAPVSSVAPEPISAADIFGGGNASAVQSPEAMPQPAAQTIVPPTPVEVGPQSVGEVPVQQPVSPVVPTPETPVETLDF